MPSGKRIVQNYEELAELTEQRGDAQMRDRFLILAADTALANGQRDDAERLHGRLLQLNPHHLLRPYPSLREALKSPDVASYLADLRHTFPPDEAFRLLEKLRSEEGDARSDVPPLEAADSRTAPEAETLQIYRYAEAEDEAPAAVEMPIEPAAAAKARPPQRRAAPPEENVAPPVEAPEVFPYPTDTPLPRLRQRRVSEADEPPSAVSVAVSSALFGLVLLAGAALLVYTLTRPFLPL